MARYFVENKIEYQIEMLIKKKSIMLEGETLRHENVFGKYL